MLWFVAAFCAGSAAVQFLPVLPGTSCLLLLAGAGALSWTWKPAVAALLLGLAWTAFGAHQALAGDWPCTRDREAVDLEGLVTAPAMVRDGRVDFDVRVSGPPAGEAALRLRLSWYETSIIPLPGQSWRMSVRLRCRNGFSNPGAPDRELELLRQGIGGTGYVTTGATPQLIADLPWRYPVQRLRARIASDIGASPISGATAAVLQGLSVGVRGNVPEDLWDAFAATGVAHLMAISGLHVTGCALFALLLVRMAWRFSPPSPRGRRVGAEMAIIVAVTAAYALLAGASLPTLRTLVMVVIVAMQRVLRRPARMSQTLALAALLLVAADPLAVSSSGFWLSFAATAALLALVEGPAQGWLGNATSFLRAQGAILWVLTPVMIVAFGRFSLIAPLANAIAIPVFSLLLLPAILLGTILAALSPGLADGIWQALAAALDAAWPWFIAAGRLTFAIWWPAAQPLALVAIAGAAAFAALLLPVRGLRAAAFVMLIALAFGGGGRPADGGWTLTVLDVGQGLAAVAQTRDHMLVFDTGPRWRSGSAAARVSLLPWLRARGIRRIDRLVLSHDDSDHTGGGRALRDAMPVGHVMAGPRVRLQPPPATCHRGESWRWDGVEFSVLHPGRGTLGSDNDDSCVLRVAGAGGSALMLADPENAAEQELLLQPLASDIVLVPHHGSRTSSGPQFVAAIGARLGIVSAGFGNRWNLPDAGVVARWQTAGTTVLTTADAGAITVQFAADRAGYQFTTERQESRRWWRRNAAP